MPAEAVTTTAATVLSPDELREHWQGHRRLTRRVIEAFPPDALFSFSLGGMRPFSELAAEMLGMAAPMVRGVVTGEWQPYEELGGKTKEEVLAQWDTATREIDELWPKIPPHRFQEEMKAFGQYEGKLYDLLLYCVDNDIHHRGQGYVYLRSLGIEPPPFYIRD